MTTTAPMFSDIELSDPDEMMKVTNTGKVRVEWDGFRRVYVLEPNKPQFIPFHVVCKYLGDPRSQYQKTETYNTPSGEKGVIPERKGELVRLGVLYGVYQLGLHDLPRLAPKVTVTTLTDRVLEFPIHNPDATSYSYASSDTSMIDVRTELDRVRRQMAELENRQAALTHNMLADDPEAGEAQVDSPPGT